MLKDNQLLKDLGQDNVLKVIGVVVIVVLFGFFIGKPTIQGYSAYSNAKDSGYSISDYGARISEIKQELETTSADLETCDEYNQRLADSVDLLIACQSNLSDKDYELKECENKDFLEMDAKITELTACQNELEESAPRKSNIIKNAARTICCKEQVDDPSINSYNIEDDKIICANGGDSPITC